MNFSLGLLLEALFSVADTMLFSSCAGRASLALNGALSLDPVYEIQCTSSKKYNVSESLNR